jgi:hypothetical protein
VRSIRRRVNWKTALDTGDREHTETSLCLREPQARAAYAKADTPEKNPRTYKSGKSDPPPKNAGETPAPKNFVSLKLLKRKVQHGQNVP